MGKESQNNIRLFPKYGTTLKTIEPKKKKRLTKNLLRLFLNKTQPTERELFCKFIGFHYLYP
jgi:hypothetical protein